MREALHQVAASLTLRRTRRSRRFKRGRLDLRATAAASLARDGVPLRRIHRRRTLARARLLLLVDVSGSVRHAARYTAALAGALRGAFAATRAFAFVHHPHEITHLLEHPDLLDDERFTALMPEVDPRGKSDFGNTFFRLLHDHERLLGRDTLLVVLGDARNNHADPLSWALAAIRQRVGRLLWLNPEPRARWGTGDSAWAAYAPSCDQASRCASTADLVEAARRWVQLAARWRST